MNSACASRLTVCAGLPGHQRFWCWAPAAAGYESHKGNIVDAQQGLQDKADGQLSDTRKKETTATHNFEMLKQSLEDPVKFASKGESEPCKER